MELSGAGLITGCYFGDDIYIVVVVVVVITVVFVFVVVIYFSPFSLCK